MTEQDLRTEQSAAPTPEQQAQPIPAQQPQSAPQLLHESLSPAMAGHGEAATAGAQATANSGRHFRLRTVLLPLGLMVLHIVTLTVVTLFLVTAQLLAQGGQALHQSEDLFKHLLDPNLQSQATFVMALIVVPIYWFILRAKRRRKATPDQFEHLTASSLIYPLVLVPVAIVLVNLWMNGLDHLSQHSQWIKTQMENYAQLSNLIGNEHSNPFWAFVGLVIAAPVAEELLFRGVIFSEIEEAFGRYWAAFITAVLFAAFHMNFVQSSYVFIPGLILPIGMLYCRNITAPILMHMLFNFLGGYLSIFFAHNSTYQAWMNKFLLICCTIAVIMTVIMVVNRIRARKRATLS